MSKNPPDETDKSNTQRPKDKDTAKAQTPCQIVMHEVTQYVLRCVPGSIARKHLRLKDATQQHNNQLWLNMLLWLNMFTGPKTRAIN